MPQLVLHFVYGLTDPRFSGIPAVRYIGVTIDPNVRYRTHLSCPQHDPAEKNAWVQDVYAAGLEPGIEIFEVFKAPQGGRVQAAERETHWIRYYAGLGANLLNLKKMPTSEKLSDLSEEELLSYGLDLETAKVIDQLFSFPGQIKGALLGGEPD
jgi:hypothetical protein